MKSYYLVLDVVDTCDVYIIETKEPFEIEDAIEEVKNKDSYTIDDVFDAIAPYNYEIIDVRKRILI